MRIIREAKFKFVPFSIKQKKILTWWIKGESPYSDKDGIICDGAVRAGKTLIMSLSFVIWAMDGFNYTKFGMAGKTIGSFRRNVLFTLKLILKLRGYKVEEKKTENFMTIRKNGKENYFFFFGGRDERSQDLVQGFTSGGFFFDEVALMPQSFVNQAVARCSVEGRKLWFNCNPDGEYHWFKTEWLDQKEQKNLYHLHFLLEDNPSLSPKTIAFYKNMFHGVFYQRFILGLWVLAQGVIYDMFDDENTYVDGAQDAPDLSRYHKRYYTSDYGTTNPCVLLEIIEQDGFYYVDDEYYYDSKVTLRQKDDSEYAEDFERFINGKPYRMLIIDPSAASFKVALRKKGIRCKDANNDVLDGIRLVASLYMLKRLKVNKKCKNYLKERGSYLWDEKAALRGVEQPLKENDHTQDAVRYFCKTVIRVIPKF